MMKHWTDENGAKRSDPDCADEWLFEIWAIGCDYDGCQSAEELKKLVGELVEMAKSARECLWQGKLFGVYGGDVPDTNVDKWIPVTDRMPQNFVSVLGYMPDAKPFPSVRECYTVGTEFYFPALRETQPVTHWMPMPEPPKIVSATSEAECKYLGSGPLEGRCMATKDTEPCVGPGACTVYKPARTKLGGDVLLEALVVFESAQQAAERRGEEAFTCPLCGGKAWWSRATLNGHLHCGCDGCHFELRE